MLMGLAFIILLILCRLSLSLVLFNICSSLLLHSHLRIIPHFPHVGNWHWWGSPRRVIAVASNVYLLTKANLQHITPALLATHAEQNVYSDFGQLIYHLIILLFCGVCSSVVIDLTFAMLHFRHVQVPLATDCLTVERLWLPICLRWDVAFGSFSTVVILHLPLFCYSLSLLQTIFNVLFALNRWPLPLLLFSVLTNAFSTTENFSWDYRLFSARSAGFFNYNICRKWPTSWTYG